MSSNKALEIVGLDVKVLISKLTTAFADEWMAAYQYWLGAKFAQGLLRSEVAAELMVHYQEEMNHAAMLADRINQLGGELRLFPQDWHKVGGCHYDAISNVKMLPVLQENLKGEQCAIQFYNDLLKMVDGKDFVTYNIVLKILEDEIEHEQDILQFLEDIAAYTAK